MIFQSSMGPRKLRCDVLSGITQKCLHPQEFINDVFSRQNQVVIMHLIDIIQGVDEYTTMLIA
jgi:hypothetical protein